MAGVRLRGRQEQVGEALILPLVVSAKNHVHLRYVTEKGIQGKWVLWSEATILTQQLL